MRPLLLLLPFLLCTCASAQLPVPDTLTAQPDSLPARQLLTRVAWEETADSPHPGYVLLLTPEGNFNEDAGAEGRRKYRNLLGRWQLDSTDAVLTLSVDGLMGQGLLPNRYLRGRDYFVDYSIVALNDDTLTLLDQLTGKRRFFVATSPNRVEDQAKKRLPKADAPAPTTWTLPDFGGGR